ncbi:MAG TPA: hypothetical protein ENI70_00280, partial [Candidatus Peregrinibacteria bacterium]|nr:hypothetical protein [Candidatus Peregrinibacteria bacterium]
MSDFTEKRSVSRSGEITDEQVKGAAIRVLMENQSPNTAKFTEGNEMRSKLRELFVRLGIRIDITELAEQLEQQYKSRLETLKHFGFLDEKSEAKEGDIPPPSFEKAMSTLMLEELEVASCFQELIFLLIPETSFAAKVKAIDSHKMDGQHDTFVSDIFTETDSGSEKITGWRVVIVDGAQEMKFYRGDDAERTLEERIKKRKAYRKPSEKGMDRHKYAL